MKRDKLSKLPLIFDDWGYYIEENRVFNRLNKEIGFSVKTGKNKGLKMVWFHSGKNRFGYTINEVLAWHSGKFDDIDNPESIFVNDDLTFIDTRKRLEQNLSKSKRTTLMM